MITLSELISSAEKSPYTLQELQGLVIDWAKPKEIKANKQKWKIVEEFGEMASAYLKGNTIKLIDGIGDTLVTLIIQSYLTNTPLFLEVSIADKRDGDMDSLLEKYEKNISKKYYKTCGEIIQSMAHELGLNPIDCLYSAYRIISKRKGESVNGTFIKDNEEVTENVAYNELPEPEID